MYIHRIVDLPFGRHTLNRLSDLHIGSATVDYSRILRDLNRPGRIAINGDIFEAIVPQDSKRFRAGELHRRLQGRTDILNASLDWGLELLGPFRKRIDFIGCGNHDTALEKHHSVDLVMMLCDALGVPYGGYTGFADYRFRDSSRHTQRFVEFYHHGHGGGGSLSSAINEFDKKNVFVDADLIWIGHRHHSIATRMRRISCPLGGIDPKYKDTRFLMTGAYMQAWRGNRGKTRQSSYPEDAGLRPQAIGGARVVLDVSQAGISVETVT